MVLCWKLKLYHGLSLVYLTKKIRHSLQDGPLPAKNEGITPISRVITLVTHLFVSAIWWLTEGSTLLGFLLTYQTSNPQAYLTSGYALGLRVPPVFRKGWMEHLGFQKNRLLTWLFLLLGDNNQVRFLWFDICVCWFDSLMVWNFLALLFLFK